MYSMKYMVHQSVSYTTRVMRVGEQEGRDYHFVSREVFDKMVTDAEAHSEEDQKNKETVEVRNKLDSLIYDVEKNLKENRDKIGEDEAKSIDDAVEKGREAMKGNDKEEIEGAIEAISQASHKLAEVLYQAAQEEGGAEGDAPSDAPADEDVVDAEFTDAEEAEK